MHHNSFELMRRIALPYFQPGLRVLEIGPDPHWSCRKLIEPTGVLYHYADIKPPDPADPRRVAMLDEYRFDCPSDSFDIVFSANVIEHVRKIWNWMAELVRITKPGGKVICVNPVSWPYHEAPVDCWRLFPEAYCSLFEDAGLETIFTWHGNLVPIDPCWAEEHGLQRVTDTIAIGCKPAPSSEVYSSITLITPTRNRPLDVLERCLASVDRQTFQGWEHIVCSDGAMEPAVAELIERRQDPRRRYRHLTQSAGHFGAGVRAALLPEVDTQFVAFPDDDNLLFPRYCARMVEILDQHPDTGFAICPIVHGGPLHERFGLPPAILSGVPPVTANIDTLQVVARTEHMRQTGWVLNGYLSDGATYEKLSREHPWVTVDEVLAIHL